MDIEEYEELKRLLYTNNLSQYGKRKLIGYIENQQKELNKQQKIINAMAEDIYTTDLYENICGTSKLIDDCYIDNFTKENSACIECIKQYYEKVSEIE